MPMDLEFLERGAYNANGPKIAGARYHRMAMDLEFLERGA